MLCQFTEYIVYVVSYMPSPYLIPQNSSRGDTKLWTYGNKVPIEGSFLNKSGKVREELFSESIDLDSLYSTTMCPNSNLCFCFLPNGLASFSDAAKEPCLILNYLQRELHTIGNASWYYFL